MPSNQIVMAINIRQNKNALSKTFGHYFAEAANRQTLSTYGLAKHISGHASLVDENTLRLVLGQLAQCMIELLSQGVPVKLDGLGTFRPTVQNVPGGAATLEDAQAMGAAGLVEGIHIHFYPEGEDLRDITFKELKKKCALRLDSVVESTAVKETVDGVEKVVRRNRTFTPVQDFAYAQANPGDGSGSGDDEPRP